MTKILTKMKNELQVTDDSLDIILKDLIEEIGYRILHFCRREDIPDALEYTWARMIVDAYKKETNNSTQQEGTFVSSVAEGDTTVSYSQFSGTTATTSSLLDEIVLNYKIDLMRYRKLSGLR